MTAVRLVVLACLASSTPTRHRRHPQAPEFTFPEPKIENVYRAWKPIDYGHPLVDATIHYAPPELERVHLGAGPVPTRPTMQGNSRHLVFEASRPAAEAGLADHRLRATVYHGKGLVPRDTVVTIPSQRRNDIIQQDPRHGRTQGLRRLQPLKSGIFYVDDPHEEFRAAPRRDPTLDRYHGDDYSGDRRDDERAPINTQRPGQGGRRREGQGVRYVPVSSLSTPPTIATPQRPYGDIVNKDFNDSFKNQVRPGASQRRKPQNRGNSVQAEPSRKTKYPLGNPYYRSPGQQYGGGRLEGVLGPPTPLLHHTPTHALDSRTTSSWAPAEPYTVHASGREIDYRQEPVIFHVRDSGELVDPGLEVGATEVNAGGSDTGDEVPGAALVTGLKDSVEAGPAGGPHSPGRYDTQYGPPAYQGSRVRSAPESEEMGYSPAQLYYLCTQEVPQYLHHHLCKAPPEDSGFSERSDMGTMEYIQEDAPKWMYPNAPSGQNATLTARMVSVRLPPKPQFKFVQDNQYTSTPKDELEERSLPEEEENPYQLIYQYSGEEEEEDAFYQYTNDEVEEDAPFSYVQGATQGGPAPIVYSLAQSKVVVYKPNELTTSAPEPTTLSTTTTTRLPPTTARPFFYQAPTTHPPPPPLPQTRPPPKRPHPQRQVLFNKRRDGGGVSRPFEYLSRLSSFLSDRVFTGRSGPGRPRPERPQLITRRTGGSSRRR